LALPISPSRYAKTMLLLDAKCRCAMAHPCKFRTEILHVKNQMKLQTKVIFSNARSVFSLFLYVTANVWR
jgi:uncharacterized protein YfcZ (UPF0381/DUF406 family)